MISAESRAGRYKHFDIEKAANHLDETIDARADKGAGKGPRPSTAHRRRIARRAEGGLPEHVVGAAADKANRAVIGMSEMNTNTGAISPDGPDPVIIVAEPARRSDRAGSPAIRSPICPSMTSENRLRAGGSN